MGRAWMRWRSPAQKDSLPSWNAATMRNLRGGERRTPSRPDRRHRRSRSNLQPYSSIKMEALLWCDCSLDTFTWSALRFPVAGPEHGAEYTSPGSRSTRAFWQRRRRAQIPGGKECGHLHNSRRWLYALGTMKSGGDTKTPETHGSSSLRRDVLVKNDSEQQHLGKLALWELPADTWGGKRNETMARARFQWHTQFV